MDGEFNLIKLNQIEIYLFFFYFKVYPFQPHHPNIDTLKLTFEHWTKILFLEQKLTGLQ